MKSRIQIKTEAKQLIRQGKLSPLLVSAIVLVILWIMNYLDPTANYSNAASDELQRMLEQGEAYVPAQLPLPSLMETFFAILLSLISVILYAGFFSYCMGIRSGREMGISSLLDGLGIAGKVIWCNFLTSIRMALWSMLFVIPGIIALYRYRFAMYNLIRDPSLSVSQAIALSCRQTRGMKMDLFVLDVSFIGWNLLSLLTLGILNIWVLPYTTLADLGYYENALERIKDDTAPPHTDPEQPNS